MAWTDAEAEKYLRRLQETKGGGSRARKNRGLLTLHGVVPAPVTAPDLKVAKAAQNTDPELKDGKSPKRKPATKKASAKKKRGGSSLTPSFRMSFGRAPKLGDPRLTRPARPQRNLQVAPLSNQTGDPSPERFEELRRQWIVNARYVLLAGDDQGAPDVVAAIERNRVIEALWERWRELGHFSWPSTDPAVTAGGSFEDGLEELGMLRYLGYRVGKSSDLSLQQRRHLLDMIFRSHLPPLNSLTYMRQWAGPKSGARLKKMADTIAAHTRNRKRVPGDRFAVAIGDWEADLRYLKKAYYDGRFDWPRT